ncbi:MAG: porin [Bacteroidetes bacterium]|nr:porin [Fibrella sp.]
MRKLILLLTCVASTFLTNAGIMPADTVAPVPGKFTFSGYMDTYYMANFNNPQDRLNTGVNGTARAFDQRAGQFQLGLIQTKGTYTSDKIDAVIDLTFGNNADLGNYGNTVSLNTGAATSSALVIKQAYMTLKATPKLSFTAGQFGTHIGYEVIDAPVNYNYSLSNLFNNGPFYHLGVKAQYAFSDKVYLMAGIVNNVDRNFDNNRAKGFISQLFFAPVSGWNVYLNAIVSNEANVRSTGTDSTGNYALFDLTATYQITPRFFLGLNAATGSQKGGYQQGNPYFTGTAVADRQSAATWGGVAVYGNYTFSDKVGFGARYEMFDNESGARALVAADGSGVGVNSLTFTGNFTVADGHLLLKPELRVDSYSKNKFIDGDGNLTTSQTTLGLAAIFKY